MHIFFRTHKIAFVLRFGSQVGRVKLQELGEEVWTEEVKVAFQEAMGRLRPHSSDSESADESNVDVIGSGAYVISATEAAELREFKRVLDSKGVFSRGPAHGERAPLYPEVRGDIRLLKTLIANQV